MLKSVAIVGADMTSLAAAVLLASKGYNVSIYEKKPQISSHNCEIQLGEYRFNVDPTFLNMLNILKEVFQFASRNMEDYMEMTKIEPMYQLIYHDKKVNMTQDCGDAVGQIASHTLLSDKDYKRYIEERRRKKQKIASVLQESINRLTELLQPKLLEALEELGTSESLRDKLCRYYIQEEIRETFISQETYLNISPWENSDAFTILSSIEYADGAYHVKGGAGQLLEALIQVAQELGVKIYTECTVGRLWIENNQVLGLILENGEYVVAEEVIVNTDDTLLLPKLATEKALEKENQSIAPTFMLYLGINKEIDFAHHTIWFAEDYPANVEKITNELIGCEDLSIYIQNAAVTDPTVAAQGKSALFILAPLPSHLNHIDWCNCEREYRDLLVNMLEKKLKIDELEQYIEVEKVISPRIWAEEKEVYDGTTYNLGHKLAQLLTFRLCGEFEGLNRSLSINEDLYNIIKTAHKTLH